MSYYPPSRSSRNNIKVKLDLSNYTTKNDVKILLMLMLVVLRVKLI